MFTLLIPPSLFFCLYLQHRLFSLTSATSDPVHTAATTLYATQRHEHATLLTRIAAESRRYAKQGISEITPISGVVSPDPDGVNEVDNKSTKSDLKTDETLHRLKREQVVSQLQV